MTEMTTPVLLQRSLAAVYRFHDVFFEPADGRTPLIERPLNVTIPALRWSAFRSPTDLTYRFSWLILTQPIPSNRPSPPQPASFAVEVTDPSGDYVNFEDPANMALSLPLPVSAPPRASDFLITKPLWPTAAFRPPSGETAVRGTLSSPTAQSVADLKVEIWLGAAPAPPAGTPFTRTNANGDFLYRLPLLKGSPGNTLMANIRLNGGAVAVTPASLPILIGHTRNILFLRT